MGEFKIYRKILDYSIVSLELNYLNILMKADKSQNNCSNIKLKNARSRSIHLFTMFSVILKFMCSFKIRTGIFKIHFLHHTCLNLPSFQSLSPLIEVVVLKKPLVNVKMIILYRLLIMLLWASYSSHYKFGKS